MLTLPAIAFQIPVPPVAWRADSGFRHDAATSAADVIRYEQDELGNPLGITAALILELENYSAASLVWVTFQRHDAARYGKPERVKIDGQAYVIAEDGDGGFLILFCDDPAPLETEGYTMSKPADDMKADAETQAEAAAKHEQERDLAASKGEALPGDPAPAPAQAIEPEDEKKKGAAAEADPGITPLVSGLDLNIRPDIERGPGGDQIVTTMKNSTIDRDALEGAFQEHMEAHFKETGEKLPFEHWDAGGFLDDSRAAFFAEHGKPEQEAPPRLEITQASDDRISLHTSRDEAAFDLSIGLDAAGVSVSFASNEAEQKTARFSFDDYKDVEAYPDPEGEARAIPTTPKLEIKQPDIESAMFAQHVEHHALDYVHIDIEREGGAFGLTIGLHEDGIGVLFSKGAAGEIERFSFDEGRAASPPPALTLEAIEQDPWNAVELPLPANADPALLDAAKSAADYCVDGEHALMMAARAGDYVPPGWTPAPDAPDVHEYNEARWLQALDRSELIEQRQAEDSTKRQAAELAASTGAAPQEADDKSGMTYEERIEARAEESRQRHAAEAAAAPERGQEVSMGRGE